MRYRKLTADNDYQFGNGQLDFYRDEPAAVGQSVMTRLLLWLGEWYLDIASGTPYLQGVLGKYSLAEADTTIQQRVLDSTDEEGTQTVTGIPQYQSQLDPNNRSMDVEMSINTIFGPTDLQIANYGIF